jgi:hypothetical protein
MFNRCADNIRFVPQKTRYFNKKYRAQIAQIPTAAAPGFFMTDNALLFDVQNAMAPQAYAIIETTELTGVRLSGVKFMR